MSNHPSGSNGEASKSATYQTWQKRFLLNRLCVLLCLGLIGHLIGLPIFFTLASNSQQLGLLLLLSSTTLLGLLTCFALHRSQLGRRYPDILLLGFYLAIAPQIRATALLAAQPSLSCLSVMALVLCATAIAPVRWRTHIVAQFSLIAYYCGITLFEDAALNWFFAIVSSSLLVCLALTCNLCIYLFERLVRAELYLRRHLHSEFAQPWGDRINCECFANISHDLRITLSLIRNAFGTLLDDPKAKKWHSLAQTGASNTSQLLILIDDLLSCAALESGGAKPIKQCTDIAALVRQVAANFDSRSDRRRIHLYGADRVVAATVDPRQIKKLLYNLLSNAFKFTDSDGGQVWISLRASEINVQLQVTDNGIGIPKKQLSRIFDRCTTLEDITANDCEGVLTELAVVKAIVQQHGGEIAVESEVGRGTTFTIALPRSFGDETILQAYHCEISETVDFQQPDARENNEGERRQNEFVSPGGFRFGASEVPTVLAIEDNPDLRDYLQQLLASKYRVVLARDGVEGLEKARMLKPDLIITDGMMPRRSGQELLRAIRSDCEMRSLPVIFLSARPDTDARIQCLNAGADDYLTKPFQAEELLARIQNLLRVRAQERELARLNGELEAANQALKHLVSTDCLTQLANRRCFDEVLQREWRRMARERAPLSLILCDIDYFKLYNDTYGHQAGDACLREVAAAIGGSARRPADLVARYGGEEFVAILPRTPLEGAVHVAEDMRAKVAQLAIAHASSPIKECVSLSLGVACVVPSSHCSSVQLIAAADAALYQAKREGRDRAVLHPSLEVTSLE